ncbi:hypothetical protein [Nodosilinea sp. LEGE 06152]|uniref:hypothetical protein n=1 Tax=Nodosilinea sp. LEGE 06152 TaxID=2777966 RepID=UPI001D14698E|nr:hypothetical protein [Nodosilinea sp. LEGE 06152]
MDDWYQIKIAKQIEAYGRLSTQRSNPSDLQNPTLVQLRDWYRIARAMEVPESTLETIKTIGQRVAEGKPMPRKYWELMPHQVQSYWQQVITVIQQAEQILEKVGQHSATGITFEGCTYRIDCIYDETLQVLTQQRGIILAVEGSRIHRCHLSKVDFQQFTCFNQQISQPVSRVSLLELV